MSVKIKHEDKNDNINNENIISLGNDQIKSVLKMQSEAVFQDKNISNNTSFIKKSLIDIALAFESKKEKENNLSNEIESANLNKVDTKELQMQKTETIDQKNKNETTSPIESTDIKDSLSDNKIEGDIDLAKDIKSEEMINNQVTNESEYNKDLANYELDDDNSKKDEEILNQDLENNKEETQHALNSVRDAVSQSINKSDNEIAQTTKTNDPISNIPVETILNDIEDFKGIFSSLSRMSEKAIYDVMENKILDIAKELAGYQIDKMPEKYEKKIKAFLKNINCFEEKITIEVNDKDLEALSKIKDFKNISQKSQFLPNKDILRGDIILNCDGMYYSEKTLKKD